MSNEGETGGYEPTQGPSRPPSPPTSSQPPTDPLSEYQATAKLGRESEPPPPGPAQSSGNSWTTPGTVVGTGQILFGKYEVVRQLGKGGMGAVWLVRHCDLNVLRALKTIEEGISNDAEAHSRFRREAEVMARFIHPHAVTVHDARLTAGDVAFIEMEYVEGQPLNKFLKAGTPMPLDWIARILEQLCDVLQVASEKGIVHRDLKPSNLMLLDGLPPGREHLKVLDFGIAKLVGDDARRESSLKTTGYLGTPSYSSPEQCKGHDRPDTPIDARSDLYSVGVLLYEWLTGHRPFVGNPVNVLHDQIHTPPPPFSTKTKTPRGGPALEQFTLRCLSKSPARRPQSARKLYEEFLTALAKDDPTAFPRLSTRLLEGSDLEHHPPRPPLLVGTSEHRGGRWQKVIAAMAATLIVAGAAAFLTMTMLSQGDRSQAKGQPDGQPKKSAEIATTPPQPRLPEGYRGEGSANPDGLYATIIRESDQARFRLMTGHYVPDRFNFDPANGLAQDGWPAILTDADGTKYLRIPASEFQMGSVLVGGPDLGDRPPVSVRLDGFYLQENEATNGQVARFFQDHRAESMSLATDKKSWEDSFNELISKVVSRDEAMRYPATNVTRTLAEAVARSLGGNLPLEAQWECAARSGGLPRPQVWGDERPTSELANIDHLRDADSGPSLPGSFSKDTTIQGVKDMAGNVREWCRDAYRPYVQLKGTESWSAPLPGPDDPCVIRGGAFTSFLQDVSTTARRSEAGEGPPKPNFSAYDLGFRIALECAPDPPPHAQNLNSPPPPRPSGLPYPQKEPRPTTTEENE